MTTTTTAMTSQDLSRGPSLDILEEKHSSTSKPALGSTYEELALPAVGLAAANAASVDRDARFPVEAIDALRGAGLLGAMVPRELGGFGATLMDMAGVVQALGRSCSATGMVFAMHQIQVACLVRHGHSEALQQVLRDLAANQRLFASATTELAVGGSVRTSVCAVTPVDGASDRFSLEKQASVISYGEYCDAILATARRSPEAQASDQSLVFVPRSAATLERTSGWNTLGFRGTCSNGFLLRTEGDLNQVFPVPYGDISAQTMLPVSHVVWTHLWLGIATEAVSRARAFLRLAARKTPGTTPISAGPVAELVARLHEMRALVHATGAEYQALSNDPASADELSRAAFSIRMNNLKVSTSRMVVEIVDAAMEACGMAAYREDTPHSMGRLLRDAHGARVMINNERILGSNAQWLLVSKED
jgi:acyl-CoA dehydrogenase